MRLFVYILAIGLLVACAQGASQKVYVDSHNRIMTFRSTTIKQLDIGTPTHRWVMTADDTSTIADSIGSVIGTNVGTVLTSTNGLVYRWFDGINDAIKINGLASTQAVYSFSFWISSTQTVVNGVWPTSGYGIDLIDSQSGRLQLCLAGASGMPNNHVCVYAYVAKAWQDLDIDANTILDGNWHNIIYVCSKSPDTILLYVDGIQSGVAASGWGSGGALGGQTALGQRYPADNTLRFKGGMDDVIIWETAITSNQAYNVFITGQQ